MISYGTRSKPSCDILNQYPRSCPERQSKNTKNLTYGSRCPARDWTSEPHEYHPTSTFGQFFDLRKVSSNEQSLMKILAVYFALSSRHEISTNIKGCLKESEILDPRLQNTMKCMVNVEHLTLRFVASCVSDRLSSKLTQNWFQVINIREYSFSLFR
jgi:hypothetical protein